MVINRQTKEMRGGFKMNPKYKISCLISLFFLLSIIIGTGCARKEETGVKTLHFIDVNMPDEIERMNGVIKRFEQSHPGTRIKVDYVQPAAPVRQKILMYTTANAPLDIVYLYDTAFVEFINKKVFEPLNSFIDNDSTFDIDDFFPQAIECATFNDKIYSIPPTFGTQIIFYNKALFKEQGLSYPQDGWSWEEFGETCRKLTIDEDGDGKMEQFGCLSMEVWFWMPMIFQNRGRILDENGVCVFNSKEVFETLQFVKNMYTKDKVFALMPIQTERLSKLMS